MRTKFGLSLCLLVMFFLMACNTQTTEKSNKNIANSANSGKSENVSENTKKEETTEKKEESSTKGKVHTPEKGSTERTEILDALRVPVEKELKQEIVFSPNDFKVLDDWAFIGGEPLSKSGGKPNYKGTDYEDIESGEMDNNFFALLKKTDGKWKVIKYYIGCSDVCYLEWSKEFKAPKEIFPQME